MAGIRLSNAEIDVSRIFEIIFLIDFLIQFVVTHSLNKKDPQSKKIKTPKEIAIFYLKTEAIYDLIPLIPLQTLNLNGKETYFNLIKIIRLRKGIEKLNISELMLVIKASHS